MIYIDIDGVLTNIPQTLNDIFGSKIVKMNYYNFRDPDIKDKVFKMFDDKMDTWIQMSVPNKDFIKILIDSGAAFQALTARPEEYNKETREWLDTHVKTGLVIHNSVNKQEIMNRTDKLIDDCPKNVRKCLNSNRVAKLYTDNNNCYFEETIEYKLQNQTIDNHGFRELIQNNNKGLLDEIAFLNKLNVSKRTDNVILMKLMEEVGELSSAFQQRDGHNTGREDNVAEEAVDVALCALSIALHNADIDTVEKFLSTKMDKWQSKYTKSID